MSRISGLFSLPFLLLAVFMLMVVQTGPVSAAPVAVGQHMKLFTVKGRFDDVREFLELAITENGMVVNNVSHIGNMLARTGKDLGAKQKIFDKAEALEFCSSTISRRMMEADPHNIVFCPFIIAVYTLPGEQDTVYLAYRRPVPVGDKASQASLQAVEKLLQDIVEQVLD